LGTGESHLHGHKESASGLMVSLKYLPVIGGVKLNVDGEGVMEN
jgi:hypothetical protein